MKSLTYHFHIKTKILADFQICISVPLNKDEFTAFRSLVDDRYLIIQKSDIINLILVIDRISYNKKMESNVN